jgi:signal transduction histidine kinase
VILVKENDTTSPVTLTQYSARITAYATAQDTLHQLDETLDALTIRLTDALKKARKALTEYRAAIRALFPEDSEQVQTLPRL